MNLFPVNVRKIRSHDYEDRHEIVHESMHTVHIDLQGRWCTASEVDGQVERHYGQMERNPFFSLSLLYDAGSKSQVEKGGGK